MQIQVQEEKTNESDLNTKPRLIFLLLSNLITRRWEWKERLSTGGCICLPGSLFKTKEQKEKERV